MDKNDAALVAIAIFGGAVAIFALTTFDWMSWACRLPQNIAGKPIADGPGGCFDFWVQRYQSIIAASIAATIAGVGIFVASQQLATAKTNYRGTFVASAFTQFEKAAERLIFIRDAAEYAVEVRSMMESLYICIKACENPESTLGRIHADATRLVRGADDIKKQFDNLSKNTTEFRFREDHTDLLQASDQVRFIAFGIIGNTQGEESSDSLENLTNALRNELESFEIHADKFLEWYQAESEGREVAVKYWERQYIEARDRLRAL